MGEKVERTQEEILAEDECALETSDRTALGVAPPEILVSDTDALPAVNKLVTEESEDYLLHTAGKHNSLVEFMQLEDQVKNTT